MCLEKKAADFIIYSGKQFTLFQGLLFCFSHGGWRRRGQSIVRTSRLLVLRVINFVIIIEVFTSIKPSLFLENVKWNLLITQWMPLKLVCWFPFSEVTECSKKGLVCNNGTICAKDSNDSFNCVCHKGFEMVTAGGNNKCQGKNWVNDYKVL